MSRKTIYIIGGVLFALMILGLVADPDDFGEPSTTQQQEKQKPEPPDLEFEQIGYFKKRYKDQLGAGSDRVVTVNVSGLKATDSINVTVLKVFEEHAKDRINSDQYTTVVYYYQNGAPNVSGRKSFGEAIKMAENDNPMFYFWKNPNGGWLLKDGTVELPDSVMSQFQ